MSEILSELSTAVIEGNLDDIVDLTEDALDEDFSAQDILDKGLMPGMDHVGVEFKAGNMFVPEVLRSARAMQSSMELIRPMLIASGVKMVGKVLLGTVKGDLHDIGKNLVKIMMEGKGMNVVDLGIDVAPEKFVEAAKENNAQVIACSALLTTTMTEMENVVKALVEAGIRDKLTIMVGGAPVTQSFCDSIGADRYAPDAASAADEAIAACAS